MPVEYIGDLQDACEQRVCDPTKCIALVYGAGQAGNRLWIKELNEKLWMTDTLVMGGWRFMVAKTYEPSEDPIEVEIHPCIIPTGLYRNIEESPANQTAIYRRSIF